MITQRSQEFSHIGPRAVRRLDITPDDVRHYAQLNQIGIVLDGIDDSQLSKMIGAVMDSNDVGLSPAPLSGLTSPSIPGIVQFLQNWLPGVVRILTAVRMADELMGVSTIGTWEDEQVVLQIVEPLGTAFPYGDYTNIPLSDWNLNFESRTVVRFEMGLNVGVLEEARSARARISSANEKRYMVAEALEVQRNRVGMYGYNDGSGRTYGFLNDPNLPAYVAAANGAAGSPLWSKKTLLEITNDFRQGLTQLEIGSMGRIKADRDPISVGIPNGYTNYLGVISDFGYSVRKWLTDTYPNVRIETAPELADANGGSSAMYFYAEEVLDSGTDDNRTWIQVVPTKMLTLGVEKRAKSYVEDYANATAGALLKRPFAVYRLTGI